MLLPLMYAILHGVQYNNFYNFTKRILSYAMLYDLKNLQMAISDIISLRGITKGFILEVFIYFNSFTDPLQLRRLVELPILHYFHCSFCSLHFRNPTTPAFAEIIPNGYKIECKQKFSVKTLLAINEEGSPYEDTFEIPSCCVCIYKKLN